MIPALFLTSVLVPDLTWLEQTVGPRPPNSNEVRLLLLAIAGQESSWQDIRQVDEGAGIDPWQMQGNTVSEILANPATTALALKICLALNVKPRPGLIWDNFLSNTRLAVAFARLDLWANPAPLPPYGNQGAGYQYYLDTWRPGAPSRTRWTTVYSGALAADRAWMATQGMPVA